MKIGVVIRKDFLQLFFIILSFSLMVLVSYHYVSGIVEEQTLTTAGEKLNTSEATIRSDLREAEATLFHVGLLIEQRLDEGCSVDQIKEYLVLITAALKADSDRARGLMDIYGNFLDTFASGLNWDPPETYIPINQKWHEAAITADGRIGITPPYISYSSGRLVISLAKTLQGSNGEDYGIVALDIDFSHLDKYIKSLNSESGGYGSLSTEDFVFIIHPLEEYINKPMAEVHPGYERVIRYLKENPGSIATQKLLSRDGVEMMFIMKQLFNGWHLGIAIPVSIYYHDVNRMAISLSGLGFAFMIIVIFIMIQLSLSKARSEEENMEKSSFLARMSHEIRTPMNSILGMAELIQRKAVSSEIQEYIEIINQSGNNLLAIINDILDFSKIESGRLQVQNTEYYIATVINDMINMIRPRIAEKSLDFFVNVDSNIPERLYGDDMRLRQIITNLLSNAVKYTRRGFISMNVEMERLDDSSLKLICSVKDSGIGIKPEDQKVLFSEFARMDSKANQGIEGTGLGLAITRALCLAMGGDVIVTS